MADDGSAQSTSIWPIPKFYFQVKWDAEVMSFQEVSGLDIETTAIEYRLLDENGDPTMVWTLANAWPTKISGTDLKSDGNEASIETIVIVHEGLTIANG